MEALLEYTYLWADAGGDVDVAACRDIFLLVLAASAFFFFVIHLIMPYTPLERRFDPGVVETPRAFLIFTRGQLVGYVIHVLGLPVMVMGLFPYPPGWPTGDVARGACIVACIVVFYVLPSLLQIAIDGRARER